MTQATRPTSRIPLHPLLIAPAAALLIAAFVTDLLYWKTMLIQWETFSIWLLTGGLVLAAMSGLALLIDVMGRYMRPINWSRFAILGVAALLSLLNAFIHSRDGYTAVMPSGIALSAIVTLLLLFTGLRGWSLIAARSSSTASTQGVRS